MTWASRVPAVVAKEMLVEWRDRTRISGLFFYSFALLLVVAFAMPGVKMLEDVAGGVLWIGLLLASTRSLDQSFRVELEQGALEGLVLWPVDGRAIFYGKALANTLVLLIVALATVPLLFALYHPTMTGSWGTLVLTIVLGCAGIAAPGTLVAALASQARGASALLPVLLFPLVVPVVISSATITTLVLRGDPMGHVPSWLSLLAVFDVAHWALDGLLFLRVVEEA